MDSGFKYQDGNPIYNGDMVQFNNCDIGFIWYDRRTNVWTVKHHSLKTRENSLSSLYTVSPYIARYLI